MLLVLTNSQDATANYLIPVLEQSGIRSIRLDTDTLVSRTSVSYRAGQLTICFDGSSYTPADFHNVWYRRPQRLKSPHFDDSPDAKYVLDEWAEAIEGFLAHIPKRRWMNHPPFNALASHKLEQLSTAQSLGFRIPESLVTQDEGTLREFFRQHNGRIIVKPMASGYIERPSEDADSLIYTNPVQLTDLDDLTDLASCPTLFQRFIDKTSDVRITVVDNACHAVELIGKTADGLQRCDIRRDNMENVDYREFALPRAVHENVRRLMDHYALRFAAIDMVVDADGEWFFLEVNPNGQWAWLDLEGVTNIASSFVTAFSSATDHS